MLIPFPRLWPQAFMPCVKAICRSDFRTWAKEMVEHLTSGDSRLQNLGEPPRAQLPAGYGVSQGMWCGRLLQVAWRIAKQYDLR